MSARWEYRVLLVEDDAMEMADQLNRYGSAGWELVAVSSPLVGRHPRLFLKRKVAPASPPPPAGEVR